MKHETTVSNNQTLHQINPLKISINLPSTKISIGNLKKVQKVMFQSKRSLIFGILGTIILCTFFITMAIYDSGLIIRFKKKLQADTNHF